MAFDSIIRKNLLPRHLKLLFQKKKTYHILLKFYYVICRDLGPIKFLKIDLPTDHVIAIVKFIDCTIVKNHMMHHLIVLNEL